MKIPEGQQLVEQMKQYAALCHTSTNHFYDKVYPYTKHLNLVVSVAMKHINLIPEDKRPIVIAACYGHDLIEDTRQTFNDIKERFGIEVAELIYALTNEKGRSRIERGNDKYYNGIKSTPYAPFIKLCDRIANASYSKKTGSSMFEKYKKEQASFTVHLYDFEKQGHNDYEPLWKELNDLFK